MFQICVSRRYTNLAEILLYVTAEMEISVGTVPTGPNIAGEMDPGMNTNT